MGRTQEAWERIIGNGPTVASLAGIAESEALGHAYLFSGPEGTGKLLAALAFARAVNCTCAQDRMCESCRCLDQQSHPEVLVLADANKPRWFRREDLKQRMGLTGPGAPQAYAETVLSIFEREYLDEPLPSVERDSVMDGFNLATDRLFGQGSAPSKECYTPRPVSDSIRRAFDRGDLSEREFLLLKELYEYPLSLMPYRGSIHIANITARKEWKFTRPIQSFLSVRSLLGGRKVVIVDDAHKMTAQAQNCLLKTLEEPPADSLIILVTHDRHALFPTIVSRCQVVGFERLRAEEMDRAVRQLVGGQGRGYDLLCALAENCPGKLLEIASMDLETQLGSVTDFFTSVGEGRAEGALALSATLSADRSVHRKKVQQAARQILELVVFWITEILRAKRGLPQRSRDSRWTDCAGAHAARFDEAALLGVAEQVESGLDLMWWNVDIPLVLDATLLKCAQMLSSAPAKAA